MPYLGLQHARKIKESTINIRHCSCLVNNFSCQPQKKEKQKQMRFGTKNLHFQQKQYDITHKNLVNRTGKGKRMNTDRNEVNDLSQIKYIRLSLPALTAKKGILRYCFLTSSHFHYSSKDFNIVIAQCQCSNRHNLIQAVQISFQHA